MKKYLLTTLALAASAAIAQTAVNIPESAYRRGQPDVLTPPPVAATTPVMPAFSSASFRAAYVKAGQPTMVVLWNREFTDMLQQGSATQISVDSARVGGARTDVVGGYGYGSAQTSAGVVANTTITAQEVRTQQAQRTVPVERVDLQMRSAFMQTIASAGVKLVDRNVVMRTTAASQKGSGLDTQQVETDAFVKHAKLLMEVLNTRDAASPTGWATYVSIKRLSDGVLLAEGYMDGNKAPDGSPKPPPKFEADPRGGFREVAPPPVKIGDVGTLVAQQTLVRLGEALAR